jgi:hypothetical protein
MVVMVMVRVGVRFLVGRDGDGRTDGLDSKIARPSLLEETTTMAD